MFIYKNFPHAYQGHHSWVCARSTLHLTPIELSRIFFGAHVFNVTFKHLPKPIRSHTPLFRQKIA